MSRTITISDELYRRLEETARRNGFEEIEQLLQQWEVGEEERQTRIRAVREIDAIRDKLSRKYGTMPDSTAVDRRGPFPLMDNLMVDSSVAIKWFVSEPHSAEACRILNDYQAGSVQLLAPDLIYAEIGNIVWKKHILQGMSLSDAQLIIDGFSKLTLQTTAAARLLNDAYQLAVKHRRTVHDASTSRSV